jgi:hypothetical protein
VGGVPEVLLLVVPEDALRAERPDELKDPHRVGASIEEVTEEDQTVSGARRHDVEQLPKLVQAAVDVADDDGA